jgi:hypothetical protein
MHNPYVLLNTELLQAMLRQPLYFVRQQYPRGQSGAAQLPVLLIHYPRTGPGRERAERHMRLLGHDRYRFLYDSTVPEHREKLERAAAQPAGYHVYINLLTKKWKANDQLKNKISRYLLQHFPAWQYNHKDQLKVVLKERYGRLYLALLWKGQQTEVDLAEIEASAACATT